MEVHDDDNRSSESANLSSDIECDDDASAPPRRRSSRRAAARKTSYNEQDENDNDCCNSDDDHSNPSGGDDGGEEFEPEDDNQEGEGAGQEVDDDEGEETTEEADDDDFLSSLTVEQRKEYLRGLNKIGLEGICKKLQLVQGGSKEEVLNRILHHYSDDKEGLPAPSVRYKYSNKPDGEPLYDADIRNTTISNEAFIERSRALKSCSQIPSTIAEWNQVCEDGNLGITGRALRIWYERANPVLADNETDFHLHSLRYWGMTPFDIAQICLEFSTFCFEKTGQRRIVLPGHGSCVWKALYDAGMYDKYCFLRAIDALRGVISYHNQAKGQRATWVLNYLQENCHLVEGDKRDARNAMIEENSDMNVLFLGFCGLEEEDFPEDLGVYPDVDETRESYDSVVNSEYLVESTTIALIASKQRDDMLRVESDPKLLAIVESKRRRMHQKCAVDILEAIGQCCSGCHPHSSSSATRPLAGSCDELHSIIRKLIATMDHNGPFAVYLKHNCFDGKNPSVCSIDEMRLQIAICRAIKWMLENGNYKIALNLYNQALPKQCQGRVDINNCSIDSICPSSHYQKDLSKTTREIAVESVVAAGGNRMERLQQKLINTIKVKEGCKFTGADIEEVEAPRASFHHPSESCPLSLLHGSKNMELWVDTKKECEVSQLKLIAMTAAKNREEQARGARELAVSVVVLENKHREHHAIDNLRRDGSLVTVEEYYCDWRDGVCVVDASKNPEFDALFEMVNANELSKKPLRVVVKVVNERPISIDPLVINRVIHDESQIAFVCALFKMKKVDPEEEIDLRRVIETLTADCPNSVVQTDRGVEIPVASVSPDILSRWSNSANDTAEDQSPNAIAPVASTTTHDTELSESRNYSPKPGYVTIVSEEGEPFEVPMGIAFQSNYIKEKLEEEGNNGSRVVHVPHVKTAILERVVVFLCLDRKDPFSVFMINCTTDFDEAFGGTRWCKFARMPQIDMCHLIIAAEILGIKALTDLTCAAVGSAFDGKSPEQVAQIINEKIPFVGKGDDETFNYTWELQPSGGWQSTNLGMSTRRNVDQEGSLIVGLLEDLRDEDDDTSRFNGGDNRASTSASEGNVVIGADSSDLLEELNVDTVASARSEDASLTAGDSRLMDNGMEAMEEDDSTHSVMDDESVGRDNSADADDDEKENVNVEKIRKRDELNLDSDGERSDVEDSNAKRQKSTHNAQPIDEDCASIANAVPPPAQPIDESRYSVANTNGVQQDERRTSILSGYKLVTDRRRFRHRSLRHVANPTALLRPESELGQLRHNPLKPRTEPLQNRQGRGFVSPKPNHRSNNA